MLVSLYYEGCVKCWYLVNVVLFMYIDNILKGFAASFSIITAIALSYALFHDFDPDIMFTIGAVSIAILLKKLYSQMVMIH